MAEHKAIAIESWLASVPQKDRGRQLSTYLKTLDKQYRDDERADLLKLAQRTQPPAHPPCPVSPRAFWLSPWDSGLVLERRKDVTLTVPLFVFAAPSVPGCGVTLEIYSSRTDTREWKVALGQGRGLKTSRRSTFEAGAGEIKRIFAPVPAIAIRRYALIEGSPSVNIEPLKGKAFQTVEPIGRTSPGWRSSRDWDEPAPGAETLISPELDTGVRARKIRIIRSSRRSRQSGLDFSLGPVQKNFYLKGYSGKSTYVESVERTRHFKLTAGATIFGTPVNTDASVQLVGGESLTCTLTGGHDYHLHKMKKEPGIGWTLD